MRDFGLSSETVGADAQGAPPPTPADLDAKISHLKCPIGQTLAKSNEKWTSNLRTYSTCRFSHPVSKKGPLSWPYCGVLTCWPLNFSHRRVQFQIATERLSLPLTETRQPPYCWADWRRNFVTWLIPHGFNPRVAEDPKTLCPQRFHSFARSGAIAHNYRPPPVQQTSARSSNCWRRQRDWGISLPSSTVSVPGSSRPILHGREKRALRTLLRASTTLTCKPRSRRR